MPNPLTEADLADVWAGFTEVMPSTVAVQRQDTENEISKGPYLTQAADVPCWFIPPGGSLPALIASMLTTGTLKQTGAERVVFTGDKDVRTGDRLIKTGVAYTYTVRGTQKDDLGIAIIADVEAVRVKQT